MSVPSVMVHEPFTVLLIEDNPDDEDLALRALRGCGLPLLVRVARDGERALAKLGIKGGAPGEDRWVPDLVISDFKMPGVSGDEVLKAARQDARMRNVPYVMLSSSGEVRDVERCMALGATTYATKPVDFAQYIECVRDIVRRYLGEGRKEPFCVLEEAERHTAGAR